VRSHAKTMDEAYALAKKITLEGAAERITCPLLVVFGAGDRLIAPSEGERLAKAKGPSELVILKKAIMSVLTTSATNSGR
jgi:pimeloyl-ACP methyl ester carboxylesterase